MIAAQSPLALLAPTFDGAALPLSAGGPDLTRYMVVCAVLVVLTGALALALRKGLGATVRARAARRSLAVIDVLPLGGRQRMMVVRCYDRTFLLGLGDKELTPIAELDGVIGAAAQQAAPAPLPGDREAFASALERIRRSLPAPRLGKQVAGVRAAATSAPAAVPAPVSAPSAPKDIPRPVPAAAAEPAEEPRPRLRLEGIVG